jgi:hypothetical protein
MVEEPDDMANDVELVHAYPNASETLRDTFARLIQNVEETCKTVRCARSFLVKSNRRIGALPVG